MKLKLIAAATTLALAAVSAQAANLDSLAGLYKFKMQGATTEFHDYTQQAIDSWGSGNEFTWGIGEITQILGQTGNPNWNPGVAADGGDYLYYMIWGAADAQITPKYKNNHTVINLSSTPPLTPVGEVYLGTTNPLPGVYSHEFAQPDGFDIYSTGCAGGDCDGLIHMDIYRTTTMISNLLDLDPHSRTGINTFGSYGTVFDGASMYLSLVLNAGKVVVDDPNTAYDETTAPLFQHANADTLPASGNGEFYASVTGDGVADSKWDTNGYITAAGVSDFIGGFHLSYNGAPNPANCTDAEVAANTCFPGLIDDPIYNTALPEPGSLALFGGALAGLGFVRRRKVVA